MERTTGELEVMVGSVEKKVDFHIDYTQKRDERLFEKLETILTQTTRTNGRVTNLEAWRLTHDGEHSKSIDRIANLEKYLAMGIGGLIVLQIVLKYMKIL